MTLQCQNPEKSFLIPFIDETIIASLNGLASLFRDRNSPQCNLEQTIENLENVRLEYEKVHGDLEKVDEFFVSKELYLTDGSSSDPSDNVKHPNKIMQNSIEMLINGGKFTKVIEGKKISSLPVKKDVAKNILKSSLSSLCNSLTVSSLAFEARKPNRLARKFSRPARIKKIDKKASVQAKTPPKSDKNPPEIVSTCHANCRIHQYDDGSHSFEITSPNRDCRGDDKKSEIVFVVLASGETALFRSSSSRSMEKIFNFDEPN